MSIEIERAEAITWVRIQMAQHGLTLADLQAAGCFTEPPRAPLPGAERYRNAHGQGWDGCGIMPDWLQRAINAGQTVEHFQVPSREQRGAP
ncbi:H-NS family nucleoid-associated regulatory protein [Cupriavidus sp. D39]|uniref:H-NS histone family protein n=1 Tax=Cupriavidus sp. D39 TaxID=2997877 RepID=UPI00226E6CF3|nr:H-NS family nucleoid-associated regulatory protein [Cupriavidus sp. D39]MCY0854000.1 H-NS family nucleoid-associated regulatory protein [Cupriavidus sp. D39]